MTNNFDTSRILKNSVYLYIRMLFTMWLNLYTTRLVLLNLGVEDLGVYGVIGSIVSFFAVFSSGITNTIQRFITYELGRKDGNLNKVFCSCLNVLFILAAFILILLETFGLWFLNNHVKIPDKSVGAAFWVYQLSVLMCIVNLISIPYNALVVAYEKMDIFAVISIIQVLLSCALAYSLSLFNTDRLIIYAIFMACVSIFIRLLYQVYCNIKFKESHYHFLWDLNQIEQIGKFAGITTTAGILETIFGQGKVIIINWTFGVALNAVYSIAMQLKNAVLSFSFNIYKAISPQITKTYSEGDYTHHKHLVYCGSKLEIYMMYLILIPFLFKTEYIMTLWLKEVPPHMVTFSQITIFISFIYALFEPIRTSVLATGNIKKFMVGPNALYILSLPVCYSIAKTFHLPEALIITFLVVEIIVLLARCYYAVKVTPLKSVDLLKDILIPCLLVGAVCSVACFFLSSHFEDNLVSLSIILILNGLIVVIISYLLGINSKEREMINLFVTKHIQQKH